MSVSPRCVPLVCGNEILLPYEKALPFLGTAALEGLARAIAASPGWPPAFGATLVLRPSPTPVLAAFGRFDRAGQTWLQGQIHSLQDACRHLRYLGYSQIEADCRSLADRLREHLGPEDLARAKLAAIPRGGLIILSLLASLLDLDSDQIGLPSDGGEHPVIVVDDCALTGTRFRRFLQTLGTRNVIFAPLYSPPALRAAILQQEPRVDACLSAQDVAASALDPTAWGGGPPSADFYWAGRTEALCFPWNEPDRTVWNPETRQWDLAWRIVPPELCLKNHSSRGREPIPVQIQPRGEGSLRPSRRVLFGEIEGTIALFDLTTGEGFSLTETGADLWRALVRHGEIDPVTAELAREYDVSPEVLQADTKVFCEDLLERGLLEFHQDLSSESGL